MQHLILLMIGFPTVPAMLMKISPGNLFTDKELPNFESF